MPWLGWPGLTQALCSTCHTTVGGGRAVQKARQDLKNSPELPLVLSRRSECWGTKGAGLPSWSSKPFRDLHHKQPCSGRSHAPVTTRVPS